MKAFVVAYDVFDSKRRYGVAKIIDAHKLQGQKSSWETFLNQKSIRIIVQELEEVLNKEDKVNFIAVVGEPILLGKAKSIEVHRGGIVIV